MRSTAPFAVSAAPSRARGRWLRAPVCRARQFGYSNDAAGRRTAISRSGEAFGDLSGATDAYGYNSRSEVVSARRTKDGAPVRGFDEDFSYDPIGNRVATTNYTETGAAVVSEYTAENLGTDPATAQAICIIFACYSRIMRHFKMDTLGTDLVSGQWSVGS